jgi:hypothetical protein
VYPGSLPDASQEDAAMKLTTCFLSSILALCLLSAQPLKADVTDASGTAIPARINTETASVSVKWQITLEPSPRAIAQSVSSEAGQLLAPDGSVLQSVGTFLGREGTGSFSLSETLPLSPAVIRNWIQNGYQQVVYQRRFTTAEGRPMTARAVLLPRGSSLLDSRNPSAALIIRDLELRFRESLAPVEVVEPRERLQAELRISHSGNGILEGEWQLAEPASTSGKPIYRPLVRIRQALTGQQLSVLLSPQLPTRTSGKYLLRFCALDGATPDGIPREELCTSPRTTAVTAYQVLAGPAVSVKPIRILAPRTEAVNTGTRFEWAPVEGAVVYQMQVFSLPPDQGTPTFVAGMLLPMGQSDMTLTPVMTRHLVNGQRYRWRLNALDQQGRTTARSDESSFTYVSRQPTP